MSYALNFDSVLEQKLKVLRPILRKVDLTQKFINPYEYYATCPKCAHWDFQSLTNGGACLDCGWHFQVEE